MPMLFYGDELGIDGVEELDYRAPMPWSGGDAQLQNFVRRAIALRREREELCRGSFRLVSAEKGSGLLVFERALNGGGTVICLNASDCSAEIGQRDREIWSEGLNGMRLCPWGFAVFEK